MRFLRWLWIDVLETLLRVLPFPCPTGLVRIGDPDRGSPVLLTGNFRLTVKRVKRCLTGLDAYLLVANSRGINIWCAAAGGHLTGHDVISALKTSRIETKVDHRQVVLPQLAAAGIDARMVQRKSGWNVIWGPVEASAIPAFLRGGFEKTPAMRRVGFPWTRRTEMAIAWAFPISLVAALLVLPFWHHGVLPVVGMVWALSLALFLGFPLYERRLRAGAKSVGFVFFRFGERGVALLLWALFLSTLVIIALLSGAFSWGLVLRWGVVSLIAVVVLSIDLAGSTPVYRSDLHAEHLLEIALDEERCEGDGSCEQVCPTEVFEWRTDRRAIELARGERCVQCGACIVQCPCDALYLRRPGGEVVTPDTVRRFKLNLMGSRVVDLQPTKRPD